MGNTWKEDGIGRRGREKRGCSCALLPQSIIAVQRHHNKHIITPVKILLKVISKYVKLS